MRGAGAHLARIEQRADALRPQAVVAAVPAVPAIKADVHHGRRVAVDRLEAEAARPCVLEVAEGDVAGGAEHRAGAGETRLEEQALAERDRLGLAGDAVARILARCRRPGTVSENPLSFFVGKDDQLARHALAFDEEDELPFARHVEHQALGLPASWRERLHRRAVVHAVAVLGHVRVDLQVLRRRAALRAGGDLDREMLADFRRRAVGEDEALRFEANAVDRRRAGRRRGRRNNQRA